MMLIVFKKKTIVTHNKDCDDHQYGKVLYHEKYAFQLNLHQKSKLIRLL